MRGRKPLPTALKVLDGNPGKRRLNDAEPRPCPGHPHCPAHLDAEAKKEWRRITAELAAMNLLTRADRAALAAYCQCWSRWVRLEEIVQRTGEVLKTKGDNGQLYPSPYLGALNRTLLLMHKYLVEFGLTPSARSRVKVEQQAEDDLESFLTIKRA